MVTDVRAPLFVPATRPERFAKAAPAGADAIIIDLEDAVAPAQKQSARQSLDTEFNTLPVILRINAPGTPWFSEDLQAAKALHPAAVMLPKAENPAAINTVARDLPGLPLIALIETAVGMAHAREIASLEGVVRLAFGSVDYCVDLGCRHQRDSLLSARTELVLAARLAGKVAPLDGVTTALDRPGILRDDAQHARDLGMTGKLCIHPSQVPEVLAAFAPSPEELAWARQVLTASDGAVRIDGEMVDAPVRARAEALLARTTET
ncbi:Citrate lyase subunit beta-like protein [Marinovum algicola]|uniref:Citrate lyase subunit beta / citryl-CoA lyase n=1 Tax=Marinovum algicola TaxID=42444 RepID=A0A975ZQT9_9RHOB|nr:CoA ester lyase [Marinovum algicola]SEK09128.1 citrate lyase subunit beta / citryl-CoA lyase [Marinovum algicola]SLN71579.1 Citrate lyase subunit beta-like protein [Marinovum algicola]